MAREWREGGGRGGGKVAGRWRGDSGKGGGKVQK